MFKLNPSEKKDTSAEIIDKAVGIITKRLQESDKPAVDQQGALAWIKTVFGDAARLSKDETAGVEPPPSIDLPREVAAFTIQTVIRLLTLESDPGDNSLYYLNDAGSALSLQPTSMRNLLDREFDKLRYEFTLQLKQELDSEKCYWCALILMKIICADGLIHPAERSYFDIIKALLAKGDHTLESLKKASLQPLDLPQLNLNRQTAESMLKYIVTIAMCDGEYVGQESQFIKQAAESLGIDPSEIDTILQPVASSFMILESLFPRAGNECTGPGT